MIVVVLGVVLALAAAVRSTWSPCGLSMLSQITPVAEAGRRQRFGRTAAWFVAGSVLGGLTLGALIAAGAIGVRAAGLDDGTAVALTGLAAFSGGTIDSRILGFGPPFFRRQVNEDWLNYRSWVYGGGFGWQIGAGITTYVMTAAVPVMIVVGALTTKPWAALAIGAGFGLVRGVAVFVGAPATTQPALYALHRRFHAWAEPVRRGVVALQLGVAAAAAAVVATPLVGLVVALAGLALFASTRGRAETSAAVMAEIV